MGSSESVVNDYEFAQEFNNFIHLAIDTDTVSSEKFDPIINELGDKSEKFFEIYNRLTESKRLGEGIKINSYFKKIHIAVKYFNKCLTYILNGCSETEKNIVKTIFSNDLFRFVNQVLLLTSFAINLLEEMKSDPLLMTHFYFELTLFDFSLMVEKSDKPPYYSMSLIPCYNIKDQIQEINEPYLSIIAPHCSGKTMLIPLHIASNLLKRSNSASFIIVIEHQTSSILNIKTIYRKICKNIEIENEEEEEEETKGEKIKDDDEQQYDEDNDYCLISSSLNHIINLANEKPFYPVISILSPLDALRLIHSVPNLANFVSRCVFIFDDIHMRTIETDVLVQDIFKAIKESKSKKRQIRSVFMSTIKDQSFLRFLGHHQILEIDHDEDEDNEEKKENVIKKEIICNSDRPDAGFIEKSQALKTKLIEEVKNLFKLWSDKKSDIDIGSIIVFLPSEKVSQRLYKELFKYYCKDNSTNICPLEITMRPNEKVDDFYNRIIGQMMIAKDERPEGVETLFLLPFDASGIMSQEEKDFIKSPVPLPLIKKLCRVFITTTKNESLLEIKDLKAIFDSGLVEVEYFDIIHSLTKVKEELLPLSFMDVHCKMLGKYGKGLYYKFNLAGIERPDSIKPSIQQKDLSRQILILRSLGIKFENQHNLPNEPNHEIVDNCLSLLQKIGLIDDTMDKELTALGKEAAKFAFVSPFFASATVKFTENQQFAFLCSLLIENSRNLILNPQSKILIKHFNRDSDVVTLLESICEISEGIPAEDENIGLSIGTIYSIYSMIENAFDITNGREAVVNAVKWAREQPEGIIGMVDKFVLLLPQEEFIKKRKASFKYVVNAAPGCEPTLVYKANKIFKFDDEKDDEPAIMEFAKRPGWIGLQCPGKIITLSLLIEEENKLNRGLIIHRNISAKKENLGVVSYKVNNPSLNSFFFISLFEAYWGNKDMHNEFVAINHSPVPNKDFAFLIHMTNNDDQIFLNYCPLTKNTDDLMKSAIPLLSSLMPFVARSIIAKVDLPLCVVEINGYGTARNYSSFIHLINEPDSDLPFVYPVNNETLKYAMDNIDKLPLTRSPIRFAITGESFIYNSIGGIENDADLAYPNIAPSLTSVFDSSCKSHLVLIVDKDFPNKPAVPPLSWLPKDGLVAVVDKNTDTEQNKMIVDVANKIMPGFGHVERSADIFYVTLGNGYPKAGKMIDGGEIPEGIRGKIGYTPSEEGAFKLGIYPLIRYFIKEFTKKQKLTDPIPILELDSTDSWPNYPKDETQRNNLINTINNNLMNHFHLKEDSVQSSFIGTSMIAIRFEGLPEELVTHEIDDKTYDNYIPCKADNEIMNVLRNIGTIDLQVSQIIHEPTINICVQHMHRFAVSNDEFIEKVTKDAEKFGFLKIINPEYIDGPENLEEEQLGVIGRIDVELVGMASGLVFSTIITKEFKIKAKKDLLTSTVAGIRGIAAIYPHLGHPPTIKFDQRPVKLAPGEIEVLKEKIAAMDSKNKWSVNKDFNILIVPATEEAQLKELMKQVRDKDNDVACLYICEPPQKFLPQSLYVYEKDGSVKTLAICQPCMIEYFRELDDFKGLIDPITKLIDRKNLSKMTENLSGFPFIDDGKDIDGACWPQIPFAQGVYALMSGPDEIKIDVKVLLTAIIDFVIRKAQNYFTHCPNHPDIPYRTPTTGKIKCPYCDMIFCDVCKIWHKLSDVCKEDDDGTKRCPNCRVPTFKIDGCNHITCPCGKHWCYKCGSASPIFNTSTECYNHLNSAHGGYYT